MRENIVVFTKCLGVAISINKHPFIMLPFKRGSSLKIYAAKKPTMRAFLKDILFYMDMSHMTDFYISRF